MVGLDTNVLVRYLTRDAPEQYRAAKAFIESTCTQENPGVIGPVVLCELVWVLTGAYDATKAEVVRVVDQLLRTRQLVVQDRDVVRRALADYQHRSADFADCLIGRMNQEAGCTETVTFDRRAAALDAWRELGA
jgi:predicted nucleic-acid-binding protein